MTPKAGIARGLATPKNKNLNPANDWLYEESIEDVKELVSIMSLGELDEMIEFGRGSFFAMENDHEAMVHKTIVAEKLGRIRCC